MKHSAILFYSTLLTFLIICNVYGEQKKDREPLKKPRTVNLRNDFGLGVGMGFGAGEVPSPQISLKFWVNPVFGLQLIAGFNVQKNSEQTFINGNTYLVEIENQEYRVGGRANFNILQVDYLNFYTFAGGGGVIFRSTDEYRSASGFYIEAGGGSEFFIPWIKRLALDLELGIGYRAIGDNYNAGNLQNLMGLAGFHYYF